MNEELANYIKQAKESGMSDDEISSELLKAGWGESVVQDLFSADNSGKRQENNTNKTGKSKFSQIYKFLSIFIFIVIISGIGYYFYPKILNLNKNNIDNKEKFSVDPTIIQMLDDYLNSLAPDALKKVNQTPIDITIPNNNSDEYQYTEILNYKFKTPWGVGVESEKTKNTAILNQIIFPDSNDGEKSLLLACSTSTPRDELLSEDSFLNDLPEVERDSFLSFTDSILDSGYDFRNAVLSVTPDEVRNSESNVEAKGLAELLILKGVTLGFSRQPFRFDTGYTKGFVNGDFDGSNNTNNTLTVELFLPNGEKCDLRGPASNNFTQQDVDLMISTFQLKDDVDQIDFDRDYLPKYNEDSYDYYIRSVESSKRITNFVEGVKDLELIQELILPNNEKVQLFSTENLKNTTNFTPKSNCEVPETENKQVFLKYKDSIIDVGRVNIPKLYNNEWPVKEYYFNGVDDKLFEFSPLRLIAPNMVFVISYDGYAEDDHFCNVKTSVHSFRLYYDDYLGLDSYEPNGAINPLEIFFLFYPSSSDQMSTNKPMNLNCTLGGCG